jgi:hypothetical protein
VTALMDAQEVRENEQQDKQDQQELDVLTKHEY